MRKLKICSALAALVFCLTALAACGGGFDAAGLLKVNLDVIYLGTCEDSHLKSVGLTREEANEYYEEGILVEAEYFADYFQSDYELLSEATQQKIVDMYKQIYAKSKYELGETTKNGETYLVSLTVYPIDIIDKYVEEDFDAFYDDFQARLNNGEFNSLSDDEFEETWINGIIDGVSARISTIDYLEPETISVQITKDSDDYYTITDNDFQRIDSLIIQY